MDFSKETFKSLMTLLLGSLMFIGIGGGALTWTLYSAFWKQDEVTLQHDTWVQVPAHVTECQVYKASARYRNQSSYEWVKVRYTYSVDGVFHESDELGSMDRERIPMFKEAAHQAVVSGRAPAAFLPDDLCCYVNPANPYDVRLYTDAEHSPLWWVSLQSLIFGGMLLMGLVSVWYLLKELGGRIARGTRRLFGRRAC